MSKTIDSQYFKFHSTGYKMKLPIYKIFRIPRKLRMYYYIVWNRFLFKVNGVHYGKNMKVFNKFYLLKDASASISIGNNLIFTSGDAFNPISRNLRGCIRAEERAKIRIGNNVGISSACIRAKNSITIGDNVKIGGDCILIDTDAHSLDYAIRRNPNVDSPNAHSQPIVIGDDVLIGTRCIILKGVTIGARSVIGAGSVVTKSIPEDCIAAGNPCKVIRCISTNKQSE